jgi:hypothetical protein
MAVIEIRPHVWGWKAFEAPGNCTNVCPVISAALWPAIDIAQPVVQFFDGDCGDWAIPKVCAEYRETLFQISNICRAHPVLALRVQHFFCQLRDGHVASADSFQVTQVKLGRVVDGLAVFGQLFAGLNDCREFARG